MSYQCREEIINKLINSVTDNLSGEWGSNEYSSASNGEAANCREAQELRGRAPPPKLKSWTDPDAFFNESLAEVYDKLSTLEKQIWGKLIVMEGNSRLAKAYLRHPVVTIDGSDVEFDGIRIGLGRFDNHRRSTLVKRILNELQQGIKVKIDPEGNIWAKRMCYCPVYLKPLHRNRPDDLFVVDQRPVKVFDIRRFKELLVSELRGQQQPGCGTDRRQLEKCCLICLKLSSADVAYPLLATPCWIVIVHLIAIELLNMLLPKDECSSPSSSFSAMSHSVLEYHNMDNRKALMNEPYQSTSAGSIAPTYRGGRGVAKQITQRQMLHNKSDTSSRDYAGSSRATTTITDDDPEWNGQDGDDYAPIDHLQQMPRLRNEERHSHQYHHMAMTHQNIAYNRPSAASMIDLRQINRYKSPVYFDRGDAPRQSNRGGNGHSRFWQNAGAEFSQSPPPPPPLPIGHTTAKVLSVEAIVADTATKKDPHRRSFVQMFRRNSVRTSKRHKAQPNGAIQYQQQLQNYGRQKTTPISGSGRWKSQDSGLGTNGSFESSG